MDVLTKRLMLSHVAVYWIGWLSHKALSQSADGLEDAPTIIGVLATVVIVVLSIFL